MKKLKTFETFLLEGKKEEEKKDKKEKCPECGKKKCVCVKDEDKKE
jgi:hypothetical protein